MEMVREAMCGRQHGDALKQSGGWWSRGWGEGGGKEVGGGREEGGGELEGGWMVASGMGSKGLEWLG